MKKKHELIMLPTDNVKEANALIGKYFDVHHLILRVPDDIPRGYGHELYILSDDEIEEGDWFINLVNSTVNQANNWIYVSTCKKIIATTDTSLKIEILEGPPKFSCEGIRIENLPQIPLDFIKHYITEYNKGNIISSVLVKYE